MRTFIALIPAKGVSSRLPRKNLQKLGQLTLLEHAIDIAQKSEIFQTVVVTTESDEIAEVSSIRGAVVHRRRGSAAAPSASASDVVLDFIENFSNQLTDDDVLFYLQPTSPLRSVEDILGCSGMLMREDYAYPIVSVTVEDTSPFKSLVVDSDGKLQCLFSEQLATSNTELLPTTYKANGNVFAFTVGQFRSRQTFPLAGGSPIVIDQTRSVDIDTATDLEVARRSIERNSPETST